MWLGLCVPHYQTPAIRLGMRYPRMAIWFVPPSPREFPVCSVVSYIPLKVQLLRSPKPLRIFDNLFCGYGYVFSAGFERSAVQSSRKSRCSFWASKIYCHLPVRQVIKQLVCQKNLPLQANFRATAVLVIRESWNLCFFYEF